MTYTLGNLTERQAEILEAALRLYVDIRCRDFGGIPRLVKVDDDGRRQALRLAVDTAQSLARPADGSHGLALAGEAGSIAWDLQRVIRHRLSHDRADRDGKPSAERWQCNFDEPDKSGPDPLPPFDRCDSLRRAMIRQEDEIQQILGRALGYPRFCDGPENFPGATDAEGVCVGDHVAASLASEAAACLGSLVADLERAKEACRLARIELSYCDNQITGRPKPPPESSVGAAILACEAVLGNQITRSLVEAP